MAREAKTSWQRAGLAASVPKVMVLRSNCWQHLVAVAVPPAESECQAAENNPFDFWKLGRLCETHQPVTRIVQNGCLPRFPQQKQHQKQQRAHYWVPFDKRGTNVPETSYFRIPVTLHQRRLTVLSLA